jgi:hypothetical protein
MLMICPEFRVLKSARKVHRNQPVSGKCPWSTFDQELGHEHKAIYIGGKHCIYVGFGNISDFLNTKNESCIID